LENIGVAHGVAFVVPFFVIWHVCFWICAAIANVYSPTYRKLDDATKSFWAASMVSNIHAVLVCYLCFVAGRELDIFHSTDFWGTTAESNTACAAFLGYLVSDLLLALYYMDRWSGYIANIIHHIVCLMFWYELLVGGYGHVFGMGGMFLECTTPFINQRYFMDKAGQKDSLLYVINGVFMTVLWFIFRICFFAGVGYRIYAFRTELMALSTRQIINVIVPYVAGYALQFFWFSKIVKGILKVLRQSKSNQE
jgi:hypothetical protein